MQKLLVFPHFKDFFSYGTNFASPGYSMADTLGLVFCPDVSKRYPVDCHAFVINRQYLKRYVIADLFPTLPSELVHCPVATGSLSDLNLENRDTEDFFTMWKIQIGSIWDRKRGSRD